MKNILSIFTLIALVVFSACEPMDDIYNEIDKEKAPLNADVEFTFTADDYAAASGHALDIATTADLIASAESIEDMEAFNADFTAEQFVPYIISDTYSLLKDGSVASVTYNNFLGGLDYLKNLGGIAYELDAADYDGMGTGAGEPGEYNNFSSSALPADYLPAFLLSNYSYDVSQGDIEAGDVVVVTYDYYESGAYTVTDAYVYDGSAWGLGAMYAYVLTTADYDGMGEGDDEPGEYNNFSSSAPPENYLPALLASKYPGAEDGDVACVGYKYYSGGTSRLTGYYKYDGTEWLAVAEPYVLTAADYDSMGDPGAYNNFSSSAPAENYLPTFLKLMFPYAGSGDEKVIFYKYYSSGFTYTRADEYHFDGSEWKEYDAIVEVTNQFIQNGEQWVFDPTETHTMVASDHQIIVDFVKANYPELDASTYDDSEYYYGASAHYTNFDIRNFNSDVFDSWEEAVVEALSKVLLPALYPNATLQVNGVDMYYKLVFDTYSGADGTYSMTFQVTKAGPNPEFTFVEESLTQL